MATDLAAQLQQVAARAGVDTKRSKGQASLLYDSRQAADLGAEQIYDIASQGLYMSLFCYIPLSSSLHFLCTATLHSCAHCHALNLKNAA